MAVTGSLVTGLKVGPLTLSGSQGYQGNSVVVNTTPVPADAENAELRIAVTLANVVLMAMETDANCTLYTNDFFLNATDTINMKAKTPLIWSNQMPSSACFFTADVTIIYIVTTAPTTFKFAALLA